MSAATAPVPLPASMRPDSATRPVRLPAADRGLTSTAQLGDALRNAKYVFILDDYPTGLAMAKQTVQAHLQKLGIHTVEIITHKFDSEKGTFDKLADDWGQKMLQAHKEGKCCVAFLDAELQGSAHLEKNGDIDLSRNKTAVNLLEELFFKINDSCHSALASCFFQLRSGRDEEMAHTMFDHFIDPQLNRELVKPVQVKLQTGMIENADILPSLRNYSPQDPGRVFDTPGFPRI